eukprot:373410-Prorocentrum_minimum.AAC.1
MFDQGDAWPRAGAPLRGSVRASGAVCVGAAAERGRLPLPGGRGALPPAAGGRRVHRRRAQRGEVGVLSVSIRRRASLLFRSRCQRPFCFDPTAGVPSVSIWRQVGFTAGDVRALCDVGASTKRPGEAIGHKGIGFKSVFMVSNTPAVLSGDFAFRFDVDRRAPSLSTPPLWSTPLPSILPYV